MLNSHILLTGAHGFVGQHLGAALINNFARVSQFVRSTPPSIRHNKDLYVLDLMDRPKVADLISTLNPDYVIHLAGTKDRQNDRKNFCRIYNENISISLNVIEACQSLDNLKRLVFLGSCDEYGLAQIPYDESQPVQPTGAYGLSKLAVTQLLASLFNSYRFPYIVLRPTVIYGPGQGDEMFLSSLIRSLLCRKCFAMTAGDQRRDFIYVDDIVNAILKAVASDERVNGKIMNIGAGTSYKLKDIATMVAGLIGISASEYLNMGGVPYRSNEVMDYSVVTNRAYELLNWFPVNSLERGLEETITEFKKSLGA